MLCRKERMMTYALSIRIAGFSVGQHKHHVVRARVAINGDAVERHLCCSLKRLFQKRVRNICVGCDESKHRRHIRGYHSRTFSDAADSHRHISDCHLNGIFFDKSVGGANSFGGIHVTRLFAICFEAATIPAFNFFIGRNCPMMPVEETRTCEGGISKARAVVFIDATASFIPRFPVHAFAFPLFTTIADANFDFFNCC